MTRTPSPFDNFGEGVPRGEGAGLVKSLGTRIRPIGCVAGVALLLALLSIASPSITVRASTFTVTNCSGSDSVPNSLPSLVEIAGDGDLITFGVSCTGANRILLDDTMTIEADMTIRASGIAVVVDGRADPVTHAGGDMIFEITDVVTDATISGLTIQNGHGECAGAICNDGVLTVTNCTIVNNYGDEAGAIQNTDTLVMTNSTITGNSAGPFGVGGILNDEADVTVTNSTIVSNAGGVSGGIGSTDEEGAETLANTIVANNSNGNCSRVVVNGGNNLQFGDSSCGGAILTRDPLLAALGDYGGITPTMALLSGSPAIDMGDDGLCTNPNPGGVNSRDQRAITRPQGTHCDIGAFESRGFVLSISGGNNQTTRIGTAFPQPLAVTVTARDSGVPVQGGQVTITPPPSGASALLSATTVTITGTSASVTATANAIAGQYDVPASMAGAAPVSFTLTNTGPTLLSISVTPSNTSLKVGDVVQLKATGTYSDGTTQDLSTNVVWSATDATIAAVDATGKAQGRIPGSVTVTASLGNVTGNATVTVLPLSLKAIAPPPARPGGAAAASSNPAAQPPPRP